ncbi:methionine ABC transporter ATP-binding protein [Xylocopilactobacillus apicola]|uniref:ABC transporter domain-containing protein n=1 Tax=Xylocopilactobacillus apicola TaxID=2932184 RepID=A0AAU9DB19_9LACO|nr:methionine ABC transporter ATP-binding protein [Xylocopilactobacillus apicola]BDR59645.1 hypothetical protein XA3_20860 [Xylocopilactobacillus apicola]
MIKLDHLSKKFNDDMVLNEIELEIPEQRIFGVIGQSGAGKSTLIRLINGLEQPTSGQVELPGDARIGMIFQNYALLRSKTVYKNVEMALRFTPIPKEEYRSKIQEMLQYVGLDDKAQAYPAELSGGQKQRVGIARALITRPTILLCDEITSALDPSSKKVVLDLLKKINAEFKTTIVLVTHEMEVIREICDFVAVIEKGKIVECNSIENIFLFPQSQTVKDFLKDIIYPQRPAQSELTAGEHLDYALMDFAQYLKLQKSPHQGYIFDSKTLELAGKRYFSMYLVTNDDESEVESIRRERIY